MMASPNFIYIVNFSIHNAPNQAFPHRPDMAAYFDITQTIRRISEAWAYCQKEEVQLNISQYYNRPLFFHVLVSIHSFQENSHSLIILKYFEENLNNENFLKVFLCCFVLYHQDKYKYRFLCKNPVFSFFFINNK